MSGWQDSAFYSCMERVGAFLFANLITAFLLIVSLSMSAAIAARGVRWLLHVHFTREQLGEILWNLRPYGICGRYVISPLRRIVS